MSTILEIIEKIHRIEQDIEKAKVAQIGEIRTRKDGRKYKKVSATGGGKDWELVTEGREKRKKKKVQTKMSPEELLDYAKNSSWVALKNTVLLSPDLKMREAAIEELDRRRKENIPIEKEFEERKKEEYIDTFRSLSDSEVIKYLDFKYENIKQAAKFVADERGLKVEEEFNPLRFDWWFDFNKMDGRGDKYFEKYDEQLEELQLKEVRALKSYRGKRYEDINRVLREEEDDKAIQRIIKNIDSSFDKFELKDDLVLFRGVVTSDNPEAKSIFDKLSPGDVYSDSAFVSTSLSSSEGYTFSGRGEGYLLEIRVRKGQRAIPMANLGGGGSKFRDEYEFLLPRDSKFRVLKKFGKRGKTHSTKNIFILELL